MGLHFDQLVFSGGGTRCFWQGGFLEALRGCWEREPERLASVPGGALAAAAYLARRGRDLFDIMEQRFGEVSSSLNMHDLATDGGRSPHQRIYAGFEETFLDEATLSAIGKGPEYEVLIGHPPSDSAPSPTGTAAALVYEAELHTVAGPHFEWAEKIGVTSTLIDARQAARDGRLADLIVTAAVIPPVFEPPLWNGMPVIDGGMADQAPMPSGDRGRTLVMLTREYETIPSIARRLYVWPSQEVPADKIDFTDPRKIRETWEIGLEDGLKFIEDNA